MKKNRWIIAVCSLLFVSLACNFVMGGEASQPADGQSAPTLEAELPSSTATTRPTSTPVVPTPTETLLPPLELPTELPRLPALISWTGLPTYPADSDIGVLFRVEYDPEIWAQTTGNYGEIVLGSRLVEYCTITPWSGRGLPVGWKVEHEFRVIGSASFDVSTVTEQGVLNFVTYVGGDRSLMTGFQVSFNEQPEACLQAAETLLSSLRSFTAVPTSTPVPRTETGTVSPRTETGTVSPRTETGTVSP